MVKRPLAADRMPHNDRYLSLSEESNGRPAVCQRRPARVDNLLEVSDLEGYGQIPRHGFVVSGPLLCHP